MDIRPLVEAVMETAGKIKNDNMSDEDFYKSKFAKLVFVYLRHSFLYTNFLV